MPVRNYSSSASPAALTAQATDAATIIHVSAVTGWPVSTPFTLILAPDTGNEEVVEVTAVSDLQLSVTRGVDGTSARLHETGTVVRHGVSARDFREPNTHVNQASNVHGVGSGSTVVGTDTSQTLKNKTITSANNSLTVAQSDVTGLGDALDAKASNTRVDDVESDLDDVADDLAAEVADRISGDSDLSDLIAALTAATVSVPIGVPLPFTGTVAPARFLMCDGAAVSRSTYAELFTVVGTTFGEGDGSTTFNLPDLRGRTVVGVAGDWTELDAVGKTHGARTHTLSESEMPAHVHSGPSHTHSGTTGSSTVDATVSNGVASGTNGSSTNPVARGDANDYVRVIRSSDHTHSFTTNAGGTGNTGSKGGGQAHNITQPSLALNYILRVS